MATQNLSKSFTHGAEVLPRNLDCLVVGAGISGLMAAREIKNAGWNVAVVDKGRGVGGRMATRRRDDGVFDHGAQYFTARSEAFRSRVAEWESAGLVCEWSDGFTTSDGDEKNDGEVRWMVRGGMATLLKALAEQMPIATSLEIKRVAKWRGARWLVTAEDGTEFDTASLILTPPVPQSLKLLEAGGVDLAVVDHAALSRLEYDPCFAVLVVLDGPSDIPAPGGLWADGDPIRWIADNHKKGISPKGHTVTIHTDPAWSREHFDTDRAEIARMVLEAAKPWLGAGIVSWDVHRWKYSMPRNTHHEPSLLAAQEGTLVFAGDAFGGPRVEGAALSGLDAAQRVLRLMAGASTLPAVERRK